MIPPRHREEGQPINGVFLYDGDCGFCTTSAGWLQRHAISAARVVAWQHVDLVPLGLSAAECAEAVQWVDDGHRAVGPDARLRVAAGVSRP